MTIATMNNIDSPMTYNQYNTSTNQFTRIYVPEHMFRALRIHVCINDVTKNVLIQFVSVCHTELSPDAFLSKWSILLFIHWHSSANPCWLVCTCTHTRRPPISIIYSSVHIISMGYELIHQKWYLRIGFWILEKIQPPTTAYWVSVNFGVQRKSRMSITICSSQIKPKLRMRECDYARIARGRLFLFTPKIWIFSHDLTSKYNI